MKLREALSAPMARHAAGLKGSALEELGLNEFQRVLGYEVTARQWRRVFNRTIARDAGEENWSRLDLYLDEHKRATRPAGAVKVSPAIAEAEKIVLGYAAQVREPSQPSGDEKALLWTIAFERTVDLIEGGLKPSEARRSMRRVLCKCGVTLAKNEETLGKLWRVKEAAWRNADGNISALKDARAESSGNHRAPEIPQCDLDLVIGHSVKFGGRISQAWRYVIENNLLSAPVHGYYSGLYYASKSYVPHVLRAAVTAEVRRLEKIHQGPRNAKLQGAYITRDWSSTAAGDWYQSDDVTLNVYYRDPEGNLMRGQVLLMIDVRSTCILSFAMLDQRNYTSHSIRTLITRTCDTYGLPREGFYFEKGIWKSSRLLKGDRSVADDELTWTESEGGLRDLGLKFRHAQLPRGKVVERVIGQIQNIMDGGPGDAGRDEMKKPFERFNDRKRLVEAGHARPEEYFLSWQQAEDNLARACEEYNNSRNDGQMTCGLTPQQAWEKFQTVPLVKLAGKARYLLACHRKPVKVTRNGIRLQFGKKAFIYHDENTGRYEGQTVLAWFNPELPEVISVTDKNRENCFTVEASVDIDAMNAAPDVLAHETARVDGHNKYARQRYRTIARAAGLNPRPTYLDRASAQLGSDIETQQAEILGERKKRSKRVRAGRAAMNDLGLPTRPGEDFDQERIEAAQRMEKELRQLSEGNAL
jgi:hypothetical protein